MSNIGLFLESCNLQIFGSRLIPPSYYVVAVLRNAHSWQVRASPGSRAARARVTEQRGHMRLAFQAGLN